MQKIQKIWQLKKVRMVVYFLFSLTVLLIVFQFGRWSGFRQASFFYRLGDNYYRAFEGGPHGPARNFPFGPLPSGHGAVGKIIEVKLPTIIISTPDNLEKTVFVSNETLIRRFHNIASTSDLKVGEMVIVLGQPNNNATVEAKLIRLLPPPLVATSTIKK